MESPQKWVAFADIINIIIRKIVLGRWRLSSQETQSAIDSLYKAITNASWTIFVGSGVSLPYSPSTSPNATSIPKISGMPSAQDLVNKMSEQWPDDCSTDMTLAHASEQVLQKDGRPALLGFLRDNLKLYTTVPLPAHEMIVELGAAAIVTTNWDNFLEAAFAGINQPFQRIVNDEDIPYSRHNYIPLIKLHGTVESPNTLIAASSEIMEHLGNKRIIQSLLTILFTQGTVLFLGYSLEDEDFKSLYSALSSHLSPNQRLHYAVQKTPKAKVVEDWKEKRIRVIDADITEFLKDLQNTIRARGNPRLKASPYQFTRVNIVARGLLAAGTYPTASQVLDSALVEVQHIMESDIEMERATEEIEKAFEILIEMKSHYQALRNFRNHKLPDILQASKQDAVRIVSNLLRQRAEDAKKIGQAGAKFVGPNDKILLFAQSTRVQSVINTWIENQKRGETGASIDIFVCECRAKSPTPWRDAIGYINGLVEYGRMNIYIIPDSAVFNLMQEKKVNRVFFGAHGFFEEQDDVGRLINAVGALPIVYSAIENNIAIYVFTETAKICRGNFDATQFREDSVPEEDLFGKADPDVVHIIKKRNIKFPERGFDQIPSNLYPFTLVTEEFERVY